MEIAANTKISAILKANPAAIEAIASINRHFEKLRNPLLRKVLASRVTVADAARIGGCSEEDIYRILAPLGFCPRAATGNTAKQTAAVVAKPTYLEQLRPENLLTLDVREDITTGNDPFLRIMAAVGRLDSSNALQLINTFEPTPLIDILKKKGYAAYAEEQSPDLVHTFFWLEHLTEVGEAVAEKEPASADLKALMHAYEGKLVHLDVRHLEMPQPMVSILSHLETLPAGAALYVTHRQVPQFLLPKLQERGFAVAIQQAEPGEVFLLIYKV